MEFKDTVKPLDIAEIDALTKLLKSNLEYNNIKYSEIKILSKSNKVNKQNNNFNFKFKDLFNETISLTLKKEKQVNDIKKIKSDFKLLSNRFLSNIRYSHEYDVEKTFIGVSQHIIDIEHFILNVATSPQTILIEGDYGCEQLVIAMSIHYNSLQSNREFYQLNCHKLSVYKDPIGYLNKLNTLTSGTLYISNIDSLTKDQQAKVHTILTDLTPKVRILACSCVGLADQVKQHTFSEPLYHFLSELKITLPKLKDRQEDIPHILDSITKAHDHDKKFSNESIALFKNYTWPKNLLELKKSAIKLIKLSKNRTISLSDIERHTPYILTSKKSVINHQVLLNALIHKEYSIFSTLHPSLNKALTFIANNPEQEINLEILSEAAHVSPSHLSFLFRSNFGISFKVIISRLRVELIKDYFMNHPQKSITESALDTGFGDLSHFEKIFKKYTGMTPKKYKSNLLKEK